jgi:hypothetical protein
MQRRHVEQPFHIHLERLFDRGSDSSVELVRAGQKPGQEARVDTRTVLLVDRNLSRAVRRDELHHDCTEVLALCVVDDGCSLRAKKLCNKSVLEGEIDRKEGAPTLIRNAAANAPKVNHPSALNLK